VGNNLDPNKITIAQVMRIPCKLDENQNMEDALAVIHENDVRYNAITSKFDVKGIILIKALKYYYK
jgi:hypothetical protein|tara:strand:+ start:420 stop:617 length:198 start_codon:yes stop_codon:yes gene_type:complete